MISFKNKPGLIVYLTCGDPDLDTTRRVALTAIDVGADVIELGVPFSDPVADGPVIQRASERALRHGVTSSEVLRLARMIRGERRDAGIIIFSYLNPILRLGLRKFCIAAKSAGVDGALVTDLIPEEAGDYLSAMAEHSLSPVFLAAPTSTDQRLRRIAGASRGFVYAVSRTGVTGAQWEMPPDAAHLVKRLRRMTKLPIALGFGISTAEQFQAAGRFADAVVIGSAIVQIIEANPTTACAKVGEFVASLRSRGLRSGEEASPRSRSASHSKR